MYRHIAVGGTFDGLHTGHRYFLTNAFHAGVRVTIGLSSARYTNRYKKNKGVSAYSKRYQVLTSWLRKVGYAPQAIVVPLHDSFGPAVIDTDFDAIAVTHDNKGVAHEINRIRAERGFSPLTIVEIDLIKAEDTLPISSSRIRNGVITRDGRLVMPDNLRPELQKPMGRVLTRQEIEKSILVNRDNVIISVGDVATQTIFSFGVQPSLAIIDLFVERKPYQSLEAFGFPKKYTIIRVKSGPGFIARKSIEAIKKWSTAVKNRIVLVIDGEEDLLTLPVIVHAPAGSVVYYGQPGQGLVEIVISSEKKKIAVELLSRFL